MQLASFAVTTPATPATPPVFEGGIDYAGKVGRFQRFSAHATKHVYGDAAGYASLQEAIDAVTMLTVGAREAAAGIFEADGRFHARRLDNKLTFANGKTWEGVWRLEQFPADRELLDGRLAGVTRAANLVAVVDGFERHDVSTLPIA